jgi:hypothetical protein
MQARPVAQRRRAAIFAGIAVLAGIAALAPACDRVIGIEVVNADGGVPTEGGVADAAPGKACSLEAKACAMCVPCAEVVDVALDNFGAQSSAIIGETAGASRTGVPASVACQATDGPERVYALRVAKGGILTARLARQGTTFDTVLYARKGCCKRVDATTRCADSRQAAGAPALPGGEVISFPVAAGEVWYVIVDSPSAGASGGFTLDLDLAPGSACAGVVPVIIEAGSPMSLRGTTTEAVGQDRCFTGHTGGVGEFGEVVYELRAPASVTRFDLAVHGDFDTVLYARSSCVDTNAGSPDELACVDDDKSSGSEFINGLPNTGAPIYVFVDAGPSVTGTSYGRPLVYDLIITAR